MSEIKKHANYQEFISRVYITGAIKVKSKQLPGGKRLYNVNKFILDNNDSGKKCTSDDNMMRKKYMLLQSQYICSER